MRELIIRENEAGQRLDHFLKKYLREAPDSFLYRMLRKKNIKRNGAKTEGGAKLAAGDRITLYLSEETIEKFRGRGAVRPAGETANPLSGSVLYAGGGVLALNKPAGMLTQGDGSGMSLADYVPDLALSMGLIAEEDLRAFRPAPVNRLDRNTSGIVLSGTTLSVLQLLSQEIRSRHIKKEYLVLAEGSADLDGVFRARYVRDSAENRARVLPFEEGGPGQEILTGFTVLAKGEGVSLIKADLITGRSHQIRAHLRALGHPVCGDPKYGSGKTRDAGRQMLHAWRVTFPEREPFPEHLAGRTITAPLPEDMARAARRYGIAEGVF